MQFEDSVFNEKNKSKEKLWSQGPPKVKDLFCEPTFDQEAHVKVGSDHRIEKRRFLIFEKYLCFTPHAKSDEIKNHMNLEWLRIYFEDVEDPETRKKFRFVLKIFRAKRFIMVFLQDGLEVKIWRRGLHKLCLMTDYGERFETIEQIGEGGYGGVRDLKILIY